MPRDNKTFIFLKCIGQKKEKYMKKKESFIFESGNGMKLVPVIHKFLEYCNSRKNITILCHKFYHMQVARGSKLS